MAITESILSDAMDRALSRFELNGFADIIAVLVMHCAIVITEIAAFNPVLTVMIFLICFFLLRGSLAFIV